MWETLLLPDLITKQGSGMLPTVEGLLTETGRSTW